MFRGLHVSGVDLPNARLHRKYAPGGFVLAGTALIEGTRSPGRASPASTIRVFRLPSTRRCSTSRITGGLDGSSECSIQARNSGSTRAALCAVSRSDPQPDRTVGVVDIRAQLLAAAEFVLMQYELRSVREPVLLKPGRRTLVELHKLLDKPKQVPQPLGSDIAFSFQFGRHEWLFSIRR